MRKRWPKVLPEQSDLVRIVKLEEPWVDIRREASRWELSEEEVGALVAKVEEEKSLELQLRVTRRDRELLTYLRDAHDRALAGKTCTWTDAKGNLCPDGPWATWGEMAAHMRLHLVMDSGDEKTIARVLKDVDGLIHPKEQIEFKAKVAANREELKKRLTEALVKQLAPPRVTEQPKLEGDVVTIDAEIVREDVGNGS